MGGASSMAHTMAELREEEHMIMRDMGRMTRDMERERERMRTAKGAMQEVHAQSIAALEDRQRLAAERLQELQLDLNALHQRAAQTASLGRKRDTVMVLAATRTEDTDRLLEEHAKLTGELDVAHTKIRAGHDEGARKARVRAIMDGEALASAPLPPVREAANENDDEGDGLIKRLAALRNHS